MTAGDLSPRGAAPDGVTWTHATTVEKMDILPGNAGLLRQGVLPGAA